MRRLFRSHKKLAVLGVFGAAAVIVGAAWALWTWSQSDGLLQGKTGSTPTMTLAAPTAADFTSVNYSPCVPGGSCDLIGEVTNPTSSPVKIVSYQPSAGNSFSGGSCTASANLGGPAEGSSLVTLATPITIPASAANFVVDLPAAITMNTTAPTSCESQTLSGGNVALNFTVGS